MATGELDALRKQVADVPWSAVQTALDARGFASLGTLLPPASCTELAASFDDDARFRSTVEMERHSFGRGTYRYFDDPIPEPVATLRRALYPPLRRVANEWAAAAGRERDFPPTLAAFRRRCAEAGQRNPTPLLLRYRAGDFNRLHQDRYGEVAFPLQVVVGLSRPGVDFEGGEFLLVEGRARMQSRGHVVPLAQGEAVVFPNVERPAAGARGPVRCQLRHGVAELRSGERHALGIIFHDAK